MDQEAITALSLAVVTKLAPQELPLFEPISRAWFADPNRVRSGRGADETLGFGLAEGATLLTPVILAVTVRVASLLAEELSKALVHAAASEISDRIRRLFRRLPPNVVLRREQLARVRDVALLTAREEKLSVTEAEKLADAITSQLAGEAASE